MKKNKYDLFLILKKLNKFKLLNNLSALNEEKSKINLVKKTLIEMLSEKSTSDSKEEFGSDIKAMASFRASLMNKLEISSNREGHINNEIKENLSEIGKIEKQKETINLRKKMNQSKLDNLSELKKENYFRPKNIPLL